MSNPRMTNDDRRYIRDKLIAYRFDTATNALSAREDALAHECFDAQFTSAEKVLLAKLPQKWLTEVEYVRVMIDGTVRGLHFITHRFGPDNVFEGVIRVPDELAAKVDEFVNDDAAHERAKREVKAEVMALLNSVSTFKKLADVWPEVKPFLVDLDNAPAISTSLAVPIADVNLHLGLPVP